ncbi:MAG TPA: hypothetical protein VFH78_00220 [Candidatus Thermoplasmatota archaeon]|nr:hypothetical protein [Candidatus Thermoplasmatota archaeon]
MRSRPEVRLDFPFTENDTLEVRARIEGDLSYVAYRAHAADRHLVALVLTGGFSRGEGTTRYGVPVNDYDLIAVRSRPGGGRIYRDLAPKLMEEIGLEVDVMPIWQRRLPYVGRKLFWLDVRLGARVISGPPDILAPLRRYEAREVTRAEIARLLGNRAAGMLLSLPADNEPPDLHQRDLQATKAVLAAMDASLLHEGKYAPRMRERLALSRDHPYHALFATAVEWKLSQSHPLPPNWWERARDALLHAVEATGARDVRDGLVEHALHAVRARRIAYSPSQAVRRVAWDLLSLSTYPQGPADIPLATRAVRPLERRQMGTTWSALKRGFFAARARTLQ